MEYLKVGYANVPTINVNTKNRNVIHEITGKTGFEGVHIWVLCELQWTDELDCQYPKEEFWGSQSSSSSWGEQHLC